jgi:hypothetical protein
MRTMMGSPTRAVTAWIRGSRDRRARVNALAEVDGLSRLDRWDRGGNRLPRLDQLVPAGAKSASRNPAMVDDGECGRDLVEVGRTAV